MNGADIIYEVSLDLNDQEPGYEYARWTREQLQIYLKEGLLHLSAAMKSWFVESEIVELKPGANWQQVCDCTKLLRIIGETDSEGNIIRYLSRQEDSEMNLWAGPVRRCPVSAADYEIESYSISSTRKNAFTVHPPVPLGVTKFVMVECFAQPKGGMDDEVPADAVPIVKQWMLYRALSVDSENNTAIIGLAKAHNDSFFNLIKMAIEFERMEEQRHGTTRTVREQTSE